MGEHFLMNSLGSYSEQRYAKSLDVRMRLAEECTGESKEEESQSENGGSKIIQGNKIERAIDRCSKCLCNEKEWEQLRHEGK